MLRLRLVVRVLTQLVALIQAVVAAIARKRTKASKAGKSVGAAGIGGWPTEQLEGACEALMAGGVRDALISCTAVYDVASGHTFDVFEVGRWGDDQARVEVLGRGASIDGAVKDWRRGQAQVRRRWTGHG